MLRIGNVLSDASINVINIHQQTGRVGINKNPTGFMFDVSGSINCDSIFVRDSIFQGGAAQWSKSSTDLYYLDGNVGIGTNDPRSALHVVGTMNANSLGVHIGQQGTNAAIELVAGDSQDAFIDFTKVSADKRGRIRYNNSDDSFRIETNNTEQICIDSGGNVGIGTTTPTEKLDVNGNAKMNGLTVGNDGNLIIESISSTYGTETVTLQTSIDDKSLNDSNRYTYGGTIPSRRLMCLQPYDGRVGIGTTLPDYTLDVSGNMRITSNLIVEGDLSGSGANLHNIPSSSLDQNSLTINGVEVSLGGAVTLLASQWETSGNELIYNVNSSPAFKVSKDGLALPQYDVEMKGKYTAASVDPTYAWEFRNATGSAIVNDLVNGLAATPAGGATSTSEGMVFGSGDTVNIDTFDIASENFTIEVYFIYNGTNRYSNIFDLGGYNGGSTQLISVRKHDYESKFDVFYNSDSTFVDTGTLTANFATHLHIVFSISNSNSQITFYANGGEDVTAMAITSMSDITKTLSSAILGSLNTTYSFEATMAYFRIWDGTSLSASDVAALYSRRDTLTTPQLDFHVNNQLSLAITENGLALPQYGVEMKGKYTAASVEPTYAWEFRNATGSATVYDMVSGVAADPSGATSTSEGMVFDTLGQLVTIGTFALGGGDHSIEFYFYYNNQFSGSQNPDIFNMNGNSANSYRIQVTGTRTIQATIDEAGGGTPSVQSYGRWYHVVLTHEGNQFTQYVNRVIDATSTISSKTTLISTGLFGGYPGLNDRTPDITLAYFRIWDGTSLSASDVAALYSRRDTLTTPQLDFHVNNQLSLAVTNNGLALPQYDVEMKGTSWASSVKPTYAWEFRNATGAATVYDMVNGVAADPSGATSTSEGMVFDGVDDYVSLPSLTLGGNGTLTIEAYYHKTSGKGVVIILESPSDGQITIIDAEGDANPDTVRIYIGSNAFDTQHTGWVASGMNHIVASFDAGSVVISVNGNLNSYTGTSAYSSAVTFNTFSRIGTGNNEYSFNGTISYLRIWDGTSLSASDVAALYSRRDTLTTPQLDFHVNNQLSLAITDNGLALPQYDVEMKGKYTAASVDPTYAWEFRNATGSATVYDMVSGVAADPSGATSTSEGMVFDGSSNYVELTPFQMGETFSMEVYVNMINFDESLYNKSVFSTKNDSINESNERIEITGGGSAAPRNLKFFRGSNSVNSGSEIFSSHTDFVHIVIIVKDSAGATGSTTAKVDIYLNGSYISTGDVNNIPNIIRHDYRLGWKLTHDNSGQVISVNTEANPLEGTIAYFRIWNGTSLSASDVAALYSRRDTLTTPQLDFHVNNQLSLAITDNGLALPQYDVEMKGKYTAASVDPTYAWEFRNATGSATVYDMVSGVAADPSGATSTSEGMVFDGVDDYVNLTPFLFGGTFTIEFMVKAEPSFENDWDKILTAHQASPTKYHYVQFNGSTGKIVLAGTSSGGAATTSTSSSSSFLHVVMTIDNTSSIFYVNGVQEGTGSGYTYDKLVYTNLFLGQDYPTKNHPLTGTIAYFRIWQDTALSASDVARLYTNRNAVGPKLDFHVNNQLSLAITENGLALPEYDVEMKGNEVSCTKPTYAWEFRNNTSTNTVYDLVGGKEATPQNGATSDSTGMTFDGTNDYVNLTPWQIGGEPFSVEMYVNYTAFNSNSHVFSFGDGQSDDNIFIANVSTTSELKMAVFDGSTQYPRQFSSFWETNTWIHAVGTIEGTNMKIYKNGTLVQTSSSANEPPINTRAYHYIGKTLWTTGGNDPFSGNVAYFRWWNGTSLSASEVEFLYNTRETKYTQNDFKLFNNPRLDFHVNNQLSLAITENGLALPQYDVEMKGSGSTNSTEQVKKIRLYRKRVATDGYVNIREIQYWVDGVNVAASSNGGTASTNMTVMSGYPDTNLNDETDLTADLKFHSTDSTSAVGNYIDIAFSSSYILADTQAVILYAHNYGAAAVVRLQGFVFQFLNASDEIILETGEINPYDLGADGSEYYVLTGPKYDSASKTSAKSNGTTAIWDGTGNTAGVVTIDLTILPQLDFHVNNQLSLAISENGLALPQYDVEVKGNVELPCTKPTYAWEFRNSSSRNTVYDLVSGVAATPTDGATSTTAGMVINSFGDHVDLTPFELGGTFSMEIFLTVNANNGRFFHAKDTDDSNQFQLGRYDPGAGGRPRLFVHDGAANKEYTSADYYATDVFVHIVMTVTSNTNVIFYKNGGNSESITLLNGISSVTRDDMRLGNTVFASSSEQRLMTGTITHFRIWQGTSLSASEVEFLYNTRETKYTQNDFKLFNHHRLDFHVNNQLSLAISENGLTLPQYDVEMKGNYTAASIEPNYAWEFRNSTGSAVVHDLVSGLAATPLNGAMSTSAGMVFDGVDDYLELTPWEFGDEPMTVEAYVYYDAFNSWSRIIDFGDSDHLDNVVLANNGYSSEGVWRVWRGEGVSSFSGIITNILELNKWIHIVATVSGTTMKVYKDGVLEDTITTGHEPNKKTRIKHYVGKSWWADEYFYGTIAYLRFWHGTSLSASDVAILYANRNIVNSSQLQIHSNNELALGITQNTLSMPRYNLVMEARSPFPGLSVGPTYAWEFRDATGSAVVNDWVSGVAATPTNGATSTSEGMVFDGTNDYVSVGNIERSGTAQTVEIFMKPHTLTYQKTFFSFAGGVYRARIGRGSSGSTSSLEVISNNTASWHGGGEAPDTGSLNNVFIANTFVHLVIVFSTSGTTMYKDGVEIASDTHTYVTGTSSTNYLGSYTTSTDYIHMTLAYVRIWDGTSLSASDVATLYSNREYRESFNFNVCGKSALTVGGKVGIGTTSPSSKLHIDCGSTATSDGLLIENDYESNNQVTFLRLGIGANNYAQISAHTEPGDKTYLQFHTQSGSGAFSERMRITSGGNVGIGTNSPESALQVVGNIVGSTPTTKGIHIGMNNALQANIELCSASTSYNSNIDFTVPNSDNKGRILYSHNENSMRFSTNSGERMRITSAGNVGIGTNTPGHLLEVSGVARFSSAVVGPWAQDSQFAVFSHVNKNANADYALLQGSDGTTYLNASSGKSLNFRIANTASKMVITSAGNVGIGITTPKFPLEVTGSRTFVQAGISYLNDPNTLSYAFLNNSSTFTTSSSDPNRAITAAFEFAVWTETQFISSSDERIKKNIMDLSDNEALETLRLIQPKKYEYVDQVTRGNKTVYGYIAQQIKDVIPYAVSEIPNTVPNIYNIADISSAVIYTETSDISAVSTVGIHTIYVDISNVNTSAEVSMNVVMVEQSNISQNAVFSKTDLEDGSENYKLTFNDGYNTASLHESSNILRLMDASNQEYHITIKNIETSYRVEIEEDLSGVVNAQGELFVAGQRVPQNVYKLMFSAFDTATLDASSATLKLVDASDVTQYVSIASVVDSSTLQIDDDLQYMVLDSSNQLFVYGQKVSKDLTSLTFDGSYNVSDISENMVSLKVLDISSQPHDVKVYSKESDANRLLLDEDIRDKIRYGVSGELFVQGQNRNITKHILNIQNYDTANLDASSTNLCIYDISNAKHEVSIVSVFDGSNIEISEDPTSFAHEGQVFVYGQKVDDFHTLSKEYINVVTLSAVQELDRALTKVTQEKNDLQTELTELKTLLQNKGII